MSDVLGFNTAMLSWTQPLSSYGIIVGYVITYRRMDEEEIQVSVSSSSAIVGCDGCSGTSIKDPMRKGQPANDTPTPLDHCEEDNLSHNGWLAPKSPLFRGSTVPVCISSFEYSALVQQPLLQNIGLVLQPGLSLCDSA